MFTGLARRLCQGSCAVLLVAALAPPLVAQERAAPSAPTNGDCLACHEDASAARANGSSVSVPPAPFAASVHGPLDCVDCHADLKTASEFPHADTLARVNCASCHDEATAAYDRGIHGRARKGTSASVAASCADCHGKHDMRAAADPEAPTHALNLPATCGRCHGDADIIKRGGIRIGDVFHQYQDSIHGRVLARSGLVVSATCVSCHGHHDIQPRAVASSPVSRAHVPRTCGTCHEGIAAQYERGAHAAAVRSGSATAPVCADCHTAHSIRRTDVDSWKLDATRECGTCHEPQMRTYRDTFHGQVTALGFTRVATCADCHNAHDVHGARDARSTVSAANRVQTCRKCHPSATESFAKYDPHADPHDRSRNAGLYYAKTLMDTLLFGVFAFFGLHAALWLPRSWHARRNGHRK